VIAHAVTLPSSARRVAGWLGSAVRPRPRYDSWGWNTEHGRLSKRDSAMPGRWNGNVTLYLKHWHDLVSARCLGPSFMGARSPFAHRTEQIWLICGTQSGKTRSFLYACLGYDVDCWSVPKALILPRRKDFKKILDNRVRPFFDETPALAAHFPRTPRLIREDITDEFWKLDTSSIYMLCGEVADDLRSFPICKLYLDEFDLLPINVEGQGDPIQLGIDRQKTFTDTKLTVGATTPTTVHGHGWRRLCKGSHERLLIECPLCGAHQELSPDQLVVPGGATAYEDVKLHDLAVWQCNWCPRQVDSTTKDRLVREAALADRWVPGEWKVDGLNPLGLWTPQAEFDDGHRLKDRAPVEAVIRTGQMNSLYSPFISCSEFKSNEIEAKSTGDQAEWIAHVNGWRAEPYIHVVVAPPNAERIAQVTGTAGYADGTVPAAAMRLALCCDQQGNSRHTSWFPYVVRAWGPGGESWRVAAGQAKNWEELAKLEQKTYLINGQTRCVDITTMDGNNGMLTVATQSWCAADPAARMLLHGRKLPDYLVKERVAGGKSEKRNQRMVTGTRAYNFHTNALKTELIGRIQGNPGAKPWHLPDDVENWYMSSLTSEEQVMKTIKVPGQGYKEALVWEKRTQYDQQGTITIRQDNHWWDCETMALALEVILEWDTLVVETPLPPAPVDDGGSYVGAEDFEL
jgi:phage terminase large subunit GpA-like protein